MQDSIVRYPQLREMVGLSPSSLWRLERDGKFPRRRKLSGRTVGWLLSEVQEWMQSRPQVERKEQARGKVKAPAGD